MKLREVAAYAEGTAHVTDNWQLVARYDRSKASGSDAVGAPSALLRHDDVAGGVNFWLSPSFVLRAEYHIVTGNRFASPVSPAQLGKRTRTVQFGSQFSF